MIDKNSFLSLPHNCYIILTSDCNQRCLHCYGDFGCKKVSNQLTGEQWKHVFKDLVDNNVFYINIAGGEPTVHKDFIDVINYLNEINLHFILTTNGVFNKKVKNALLKCRNTLIGVKISIDGYNAESHCFLRRDINGNKNDKFFYEAIETIKWMKENEIQFTIATCIHEKNINEIEKILDLIIDLKPNSWYLSSISLSGRACKNKNITQNLNFNIINWNLINKKCNENNIFVRIIDAKSKDIEIENGLPYYDCPATRWFCEISSDGMVIPCPMADNEKNRKFFEFENIKDSSIKEIWNSYSFNRFRDLQNKGCDGCFSLKKCTRCIPQSINYFDDPLLPTPYCIQNSEILNISNTSDLKLHLDI